ncbi:MAG: glutamate racemase [Dehalococcoidia bacterium]|nr:glutamate racemase [Dehalococcoidia bacterium]
MPVTVGIFDSGVGGLTVSAALHRLMPSLPQRYVADTACFPYGEQPEAVVRARAFMLAEALLAEGCALLIVACNTASSAALEPLRARFAVPIVGMEPPLKPAVERSRTHRVAVLVTPATARGARLARLHVAHGDGAQVETLSMPGLADLVEAGEVSGARVDGVLREALAGAAERGVDQLALGCTHYGFLRAQIERIAGPGVGVVDAAEPVARRALQQLEQHALPLPPAGAPEQPVVCSVTGAPDAFAATLERLRAAGATLPPIRLLRAAAT